MSFGVWANIILWSIYFLMRGVAAAVTERKRYRERRLAKAKADGAWLDAVLYAQYEEQVVMEAEILVALSARRNR